MVEIDARGLACPAPLLLVKEMLEQHQPGEVLVWVDNEAARENVSRFLASRGFSATSEGEGRDIRIQAVKNGETVSPPSAPASARKIMVLIGSETIGAGDAELGGKLMVSFIKTLKEMGDDLWRLVFINSGVKLALAASPVLADLRAYEENGLTILACGTCLGHYGLTDQKQCGQTTNMLDIVTAMQLADKVINFG
ncbi:MAG: sulfurtransferase-like selenium metabolism protein YedF [Desulfobulbaceae bacterium]|jgi:selenium metabolism protein YedF|nr:sulfurtransferase-like selenium metabolism protein YedF [Desulfobulbaceae bacterium]